MLRDVIDLETTFTEIGDVSELDANIKEFKINEQPEEVGSVHEEKENEGALENSEAKNDDDDDDDDDAINISLAAMEHSLTPHVLNILDEIDRKYTKLKELEKKRMKATFDNSRKFSDKDEAK